MHSFNKCVRVRGFYHVFLDFTEMGFLSRSQERLLPPVADEPPPPPPPPPAGRPINFIEFQLVVNLPYMNIRVRDMYLFIYIYVYNMI